ncbi:hypothetical protein D3C72_1454940 [compost metagenome]
MEQAQLDAGLLKVGHERQFRLVQFPVRREEAAILVRVGIAEHDFLQLSLLGDQLFYQGQGHDLAHDAGRALQVGYRLEQGDDHQLARAVAVASRFPVGAQQARFFLQQQHFQQVGHGFRVRDDVVADGPRAVALADVARRAQNRQLGIRLRGVGNVG